MHKIARANNPRRFLIFLKVVNCIKSYQKFGAGDFVFSQYDKKNVDSILLSYTHFEF